MAIEFTPSTKESEEARIIKAKGKMTVESWY